MNELDQLRPVELKVVDELLGMGSGYVLDFSNATFDDFFRREVGVDIYDDAYAQGSGSKGKRLRAFLTVGQPRAIVRALTALWEYRETARIGRGEAEAITNARRRLSAIVERLGGAPLPSFDLDGTPAQPDPSSARSGADHVALDRLESEFLALHAMSDEPHARGYHFERLLTALFNAWHMDARGGFRLTGEQIDGSFQHGGTTYLLEAKWHRAKTDAEKLHAFQGKLSERLEGTRGLFVSFEGFTDGALEAFTARRIILADGMDIFDALKRRLSVLDIITAKARHASEYRNPFARVRVLFPP
ncbi:MAG: restriction endonuclease [Nitratireductor sp.]|uniref:restriction endonuclease n=1 Tax=Alphaproteobacteria TaxID=28211 RepID=UPI003264231F